MLSNIAQEDMVADRLDEAVRPAPRPSAWRQLGLTELGALGGDRRRRQIKAGDIGGLPDLVRSAGLLEAQQTRPR